jgi:phosphate ABC transporter permease protein PstC
VSTTAVGGAPSGGSRSGLRDPVPGGPVSLASTSKRIGERVILGGLVFAALASVVITVGIVVSLVLPAVSFFSQVGFTEFFTGTRWAPNFADRSYGILPLVTATLWATGIALLVAVPLGLASAMLLAEFASPRVRRILKPVLEVLAGIPSVVLGFFALNFIAPDVLGGLLGVDVGAFSVLAAGIVLGIFIVPVIASLAEDAMSAVPDSLRQGSAALGANRMTTTLKVVFPAAISGITAAVVLGISRAIGETMILTIASGSIAQLVTDPREPGLAMTGYIAQTATGENAPGTLAYNTLFAVGLTLFAITLLVNFVSIRLVRRFREAY